MLDGQRDLLFEAVRAARTIPFYRDRLRILKDSFTTEEYASVPVTTRAELSKLSRELIQSGPVIPKLVSLTSGTGSTNRASGVLYKPIGADEISAAAQISDQLSAILPGPRPLLLRLINANHGLDFFGPQEGVFALPLEIPYHLSAIVDLLSMRFSHEGYGNQIEELVAPLNTLKLLTVRLIEAGHDLSAFGIKRIICFAWRLSPYWQDFLERSWRAPVHELFAISEVPGLQAYRCSHCGGFHFSPSAYLEFLPTEFEGLVQLVATSFPPLVGLMPIIRYATEDLLRPLGTCVVTGLLGYRVAGRRQHVFCFDKPTLIGSVGEIGDALDPEECIERTMDQRGESVGLRAAIGLPCFWHEVTSEGVLRILIRVKFSVAMYPKCRAALEARILSRLASEWGSLNGRSPSHGAISITVTNEELPLTASKV
jgi:hypothetical protein